MAISEEDRIDSAGGTPSGKEVFDASRTGARS